MLALSSLAMPRARSVRLVEVPISQPLATAAAARRRWNDQPRR
jgi:hypothetical protein